MRLLFYIAGLLLVAWVAGLGMFVENISLMELRPAPETNTDAIVVLTGGSERVSSGIERLNARKAKKLFISGVHPGLTLDRLPGNSPLAQETRECCVVLGHAAETTFGNAAEAHEWMKAEGYASMQLVTANYHMPRSLLVFRAEMPDYEIIPRPVTPDAVKLDDWWQHPGTASLLATEYNKYLAAMARIWLDKK
ncbi:MAG: YdcF family protein [Bdellovibrionales bacterium]